MAGKSARRKNRREEKAEKRKDRERKREILEKRRKARGEGETTVTESTEPVKVNKGKPDKAKTKAKPASKEPAKKGFLSKWKSKIFG